MAIEPITEFISPLYGGGLANVPCDGLVTFPECIHVDSHWEGRAASAEARSGVYMFSLG